MSSETLNDASQILKLEPSIMGTCGFQKKKEKSGEFTVCLQGDDQICGTCGFCFFSNHGRGVGFSDMAQK